MTEHLARRLEILWMVLEIRRRHEMAELMRRHVNADMPRDGVDDLECQGGLALAATLPRDEKVGIHVSAKARQDVTAIPPKAAGHLVRDLSDDVLPLGLRFPGGNVKE